MWEIACFNVRIIVEQGFCGKCAGFRLPGEKQLEIRHKRGNFNVLCF